MHLCIDYSKIECSVCCKPLPLQMSPALNIRLNLVFTALRMMKEGD